jgi:hypothetical protein
MDKDTIIERLKKQEGRAGELAKELLTNQENYWSYPDSLLKGETCAEWFENGPRELFTAIHGKAIADWVGKAAARLPLYVHSPSPYRRSFRSRVASPYKNRFFILLASIFVPWEKFDLVRDLQTPADDKNAPERPNASIYGDLLAVRIDEGDTEVIAAVKEIMLGDNNTRLLSDAIINGIVKSAHAELHKLLGDLLLAARLQEGLRQSILENADNGRIEAFLLLMQIVQKHDLLRYSSAIRALGVWMGLMETFADKRVAEKLLSLGIAYLADAKALQAGIESADVMEIHAAFWAASVREMEDVVALIEKLMDKGEKYQKLVALYFLRQTENEALRTRVTARHLDETDLDVLSLVIQNFLPSATCIGYYYFKDHFTTEHFRDLCRQRYAAGMRDAAVDPTVRERQFAALLRLAPLVPEKGYLAQGKPFPWYNLVLTRGDLFNKIVALAGYEPDPEKIARMREAMPHADPNSRAVFIRFLLENPQCEHDRTFVFAALSDKNMFVRSQALGKVQKWAKQSGLTEAEEKSVIDLLALKTGDIRQNAIQTLLSLKEERTHAAIKTLLSDKNENKRLGALDMLTQLRKENKLAQSTVVEFFALMPKITDKEQILIDALCAKTEKYNKANGFGLYDPDYMPVIPLPAIKSDHAGAGGFLKSVVQKDSVLHSPEETNALGQIFYFAPERITGIFDALCTLIHENRDYAYKGKYGDAVLGALEWLHARAEAGDDKNLSELDRFVLQDIWRGWIRDHSVRFSEIFLFRFMHEINSDIFNYRKPIHLEWANQLTEKLFNVDAVDRTIHYCFKRDYGKLAIKIIGTLDKEYSEEDRFAVLSGALSWLIENIAETDWKRSTRENAECSIIHTRGEIRILLKELKEIAHSDEHFTIYAAFCFALSRLTGIFLLGMDVVDMARAVDLGLARVDALYRALFEAESIPLIYFMRESRNDWAWKGVKKYPVLKEAASALAARLIEIELQRGDSPTEASKRAAFIGQHEGAETFAKILMALGKETLARGYPYSESKKNALSRLLRTSHPKAEDNAETLRVALAGKISDKRLIEAAMYAPAWLDIVDQYLGWPGLKSAVWYFHAHVNERFSAKKETEVARYSPISAEDFNDGAFDIDWFRETYSTLGEKRFALVYDCAKHLSEGANHRRAQLFADAVLGKLDAATLWQEASAKRNKDKLLSYVLIPLPKGKEEKEALQRYENIQRFLQESKSFGAQRRASESKAAAIALQNLGRNAGFSDALRFAWRMEMLKIESVRAYFIDKTIGDYQVRVAVEEDGAARLVCEKDGKALSSIPAILKKDPHVLACKEIAADLKAQYKRARENLERAMVNRDVFPCAEIRALTQHPVVAPLLARLVFVHSGEDGHPLAAGMFPELESTLADNASLRIAHPFDLYTLGNWREYQKLAFTQKLVQPFKQIFRELYLPNEDERAEKMFSRRYAGHQVQPKKAVALLKSRLWTVDYEEGLQRVYYRENLYVKFYAAADWFSPADIEAPTLEAVAFFDRKTHVAVPLENVPPVIFSEVMRDIDLVVSIAHVGGVDPEASHSTVEMRAAIVTELLRLLKIDNAHIEGRHAKITGKLGEYTVHLGSAQAHKMGRGAINILAIPSQHRGRVFLPFADDDPRTAEIVAKILLLADDGKIKDPAILGQL